MNPSQLWQNWMKPEKLFPSEILRMVDRRNPNFELVPLPQAKEN